MDSTLVVMLPNGALECDDDGGSGMNPLVQTAAGPGRIAIRAEQPPMGRGDRGQTFLLHVPWQGRPVVVDRWSGNATQRARWSR